MVALLYAAVVLCSISQTTLNKFNKGGDAIRFNFFKGLSGFVVFFGIFLFSGEGFHAGTLLFGAAHGILLAIANQAGYRALHSGPMALTSMLVNFSLIIPFLFGVIRLGERPSVFAYIGFALLGLALICLNLRSGKRVQGKRPSLKWAIFVLLTLLANGLCSVITSWHQSLYRGEYELGLTAWTVAVCFAIFAVLALFGGKLKREYHTPRCDLYAGGAGIVNTLASFLTVFLAAQSPATILYPLLSATTMLAALLVGRFVFGEKLSRNQLVGFAIGVCSVVLLNL